MCYNMINVESSFQRKLGMPLYLQVMEHLKAKIESGEWPEGTMIPTENELCEAYGVSKITIREAIKILVMEGKLERTAGKGSFVKKQKLDQRLNKFFSFTHWAQSNGLKPACRIIKAEIVQCNDHIANHLQIQPGDRVNRIERLRLGNEEPLMLETIWIPFDLCPNLYLQDLSNIPLNDILANEYDIHLTRAVETIEPVVAEQYDSQLLGIERRSLMQLVEYTAYSGNSKVVYFVTSHYRGDRVKFSIELYSSKPFLMQPASVFMAKHAREST